MRSNPHPALVFVVIFVVIFLLHTPLLSLPYFWDEAGYYVPATRDLLLSGSLIPHTTVSNAHPPLVLAWIALWWKVAGYSPLVARSSMVVLAAFSLLGVFRLAERVANTNVAIGATVCTALYPVFFAQSSLIQVDLPAAGLIFWGLLAYVERRWKASAVWFSLAALAKETAIIAPLALAVWEFLRRVGPVKKKLGRWDPDAGLSSSAVPVFCGLLIPVVPLVLWYGYHYAKTGYVFGNPEFFRYNVAATLNPLRFILALLLRLWQSFGYLHLWLLTGAMLLVMMEPPLEDEGISRSRIAVAVQIAFYVLTGAYVVAMALIGGAVLARYLLPVVPLVIIVAISTLRRRLRAWAWLTGAVAAAFVLGWFWNPPYGFSPEDNLAYRDYVLLHENAERFLEARHPMATVLTAWPASDELTRPWLGYTTRPMQVVRIEDFSLEQMLSAVEFRDNFDVALVFSTKYEPPHALFDRFEKWRELKHRFFGYERDLPPDISAQMLGGNVVYSERRKGQWIAVIELKREQIMNAENSSPQLNRRLR
ncbi:MAG TPA: glycosyltransferase family 39 protein [Candidatus Sulfotelmatobacter sp.]|nr:glycosyltransferase family 39 protein [Candidatus Sulfotelmatobacter sp.]